MKRRSILSGSKASPGIVSWKAGKKRVVQEKSIFDHVPDKFIHVDQMKQYMLWYPDERDENFLANLTENIENNEHFKFWKDRYESALQELQEVKEDIESSKATVKRYEEDVEKARAGFIRKFTSVMIDHDLHDAIPARSRAYGSISINPGYTRPFFMRNTKRKITPGFQTLMKMPGNFHADAMVSSGAISPVIGERMNLKRHGTDLEGEKYGLSSFNMFFTITSNPDYPSWFKREVLVNEWTESDKKMNKGGLVTRLLDIDVDTLLKSIGEDINIREFDPDLIDDVYVPFIKKDEGKALGELMPVHTLKVKEFFKKKVKFEAHVAENARIKREIAAFLEKEKKIKDSGYLYDLGREFIHDFTTREKPRSAMLGLVASGVDMVVDEGARAALKGAVKETSDQYVIIGSPLEHFSKVLADMIAVNKKAVDSAKKNDRMYIELDEVIKVADFINELN